MLVLENEVLKVNKIENRGIKIVFKPKLLFHDIKIKYNV